VAAEEPHLVALAQQGRQVAHLVMLVKQPNLPDSQAAMAAVLVEHLV
jgi:hypothetical protein